MRTLAHCAKRTRQVAGSNPVGVHYGPVAQLGEQPTLTKCGQGLAPGRIVLLPITAASYRITRRAEIRTCKENMVSETLLERVGSDT